MRVAFTIVLNGLHHFEHGDFVKNMLKTFDYWAIVEGLALPGGSTAWCERLDGDASTDGTTEFLQDLADSNDKVLYVPPDGPWQSKDDMVNAAIKALKQAGCSSGWLWQVDVDEQWKQEAIDSAEAALVAVGGDCGCFHADYYVGRGLVAKGVWGEGFDKAAPIRNAYRRLWRWNGRKFSTHEPPVLEGGNGKEVLLPQRFSHYAYYFEEDVVFKEKYYGYKDLHRKWLNLQKTSMPQPLSSLLSNWWTNTDTVITAFDAS